MTLAHLRRQYPHLFYPQSWMDGEAFMDLDHEPYAGMPTGVRASGRLPRPGEPLPHAVDLAWLYVQQPTAPLWERYLWTCDCDGLGQRVYLGVNNGLMEIHRHIHLSDRFGQASWG